MKSLAARRRQLFFRHAFKIQPKWYRAKKKRLRTRVWTWSCKLLGIRKHSHRNGERKKEENTRVPLAPKQVRWWLLSSPGPVLEDFVLFSVNFLVVVVVALLVRYFYCLWGSCTSLLQNLHQMVALFSYTSQNKKHDIATPHWFFKVNIWSHVNQYHV